MKKMIVWILLLMIALVGCNKEIERTPIREPFVAQYSEHEVLSRPVFHLDNVYEGKQSFNLDDCVDYQGELNLKINGKKVTDDVIELDYGSYDFVASFKVKDKESPYAFCRVTITRDIESLKVLLYDEPYGKSEIVYKNQYRAFDVDEIYYYNKSGELETWYHIENKDLEGYAKDLENINRVDRCVFMCDDGQFVLNKMPYKVTVEPNFYLIEESSNSYIVNARTTEFIEGQRFEYSWDNKFFLSYRDSKTILYRANDTEFDKVFEYDWEDRYVYHFFEEDKLRINLEHGRDDIMGVLGSDYQEHYELDLNTLEMSHVENKRFEKLKVYEDRRLDSKIIGTRTVDSLKGILPIAFASLDADGIMQWFQLDEGYVAVPFEDDYIYDSTLVDNQGEMMDITLHVDVHTDLKRGWYLLRGQFNRQYLFNSYKNELISMADRVTISPDGSYLIEYTDKASLVSIYEFKNNQYTKLDEVNIHLDGYLSVEWLDEGEFNFHMAYEKTEEGPWQYITNDLMIQEKFHMKRKDDDFYYDAGLEPEEILIYKEHHAGSEVIGKTSENQCVFKPLYVFEVIDGGMHIWFEVDDGKGYAHRKLRYLEGQLTEFDISEYHFVLNDGSIFTYNGSNEEGLVVIDEFIENSYYVLKFYNYFLTFHGYGYSHKLIQMDTGETVDVEGHISLSPNKKYFCNIFRGDDNASVIKVFKINEKSIELMTEISMEGIYFYNPVWQDDGSIEVFSEGYYGHRIKTGYMMLNNGEWLFSWEK